MKKFGKTNIVLGIIELLGCIISVIIAFLLLCYALHRYDFIIGEFLSSAFKDHKIMLMEIIILLTSQVLYIFMGLWIIVMGIKLTKSAPNKFLNIITILTGIISIIHNVVWSIYGMIGSLGAKFMVNYTIQDFMQFRISISVLSQRIFVLECPLFLLFGIWILITGIVAAKKVKKES